MPASPKQGERGSDRLGSTVVDLCHRVVTGDGTATAIMVGAAVPHARIFEIGREIAVMARELVQRRSRRHDGSTKMTGPLAGVAVAVRAERRRKTISEMADKRGLLAGVERRRRGGQGETTAPHATTTTSEGAPVEDGRRRPRRGVEGHRRLQATLAEHKPGVDRMRRWMATGCRPSASGQMGCQVTAGRLPRRRRGEHVKNVRQTRGRGRGRDLAPHQEHRRVSVESRSAAGPGLGRDRSLDPALAHGRHPRGQRLGLRARSGLDQCLAVARRTIVRPDGALDGLAMAVTDYTAADRPPGRRPVELRVNDGRHRCRVRALARARGQGHRRGQGTDMALATF